MMDRQASQAMVAKAGASQRSSTSLRSSTGRQDSPRNSSLTLRTCSRPMDSPMAIVVASLDSLRADRVTIPPIQLTGGRTAR